MTALSVPMHKLLLLADIALLIPLTLYAAVLGWLGYATHSALDPHLLHTVFDAAALIAGTGVLCAWRIVVAYLRRGRSAMQRMHGAWFLLTGVGALIGVIGMLIGVRHALQPEFAPSYVGFALWAPAAVLTVTWLHLFRERRAALRSG